MTRTASKASAPAAARTDVYAEVTATILRQLEAGVTPWTRPWTVEGGFAAMPKRANGESYKGVNVLLLWDAMISKGFTSATWMTFKQAADLGGSVRKGERSSRVVYANAVVKTVEGDNGETEEQRIPFLRQYAVFNVEQIDGLPERFYAKPAVVSDDVTGSYPAAAYNLFRDAGVRVRLGGSQAFYSPANDVVCLPPVKAFRDTVSFYSTLAHEVVHWTGHESRLNRTFGKRFGDNAYAAEELVAELGAAFLCADLELTLTPRADHAQYLNSWIAVLKADKRAIFTAASKAQAACDYVHAQGEAKTAPQVVEAVEAAPVAVNEEPRDPTPAAPAVDPILEEIAAEARAEYAATVERMAAKEAADAAKREAKAAAKAARAKRDPKSPAWPAGPLDLPVKAPRKAEARVGDFLCMWSDGSTTTVRGVVYSAATRWAAAYQAGNLLRRSREGSRLYREEHRGWMSDRGAMGLTIRSGAFNAYVGAMPMAELAALRCEATGEEVDVSGQGYGAGSELGAERAKRSTVPAYTVERKARRPVTAADHDGISARMAAREAARRGQVVNVPHRLNAGAQSDRVRAKAIRELCNAAVAA